MTIEELEIIIKANITDAMSGIKKITDEVKQAVAKSVEPMKNLSNQAKAMASSSSSSISKVKEKAREYSAQIKEAKMSIKELQNVAADLETIGLDPYSVLSVKDSFRLLGAQMNDTLPIIGNISQALKDNLDGKYGDSLLMKLRDIGVRAKETASSIKDTLGNAVSTIKDKVGEKVYPVISVFKNLGSIIKNVFKKATKSIKETGKESDKTKKKTNDFGSSLGKTFKSGINSIKKFALSLLSVRTAFSMVSKAMQSYLSYDTQLADSIQNCWNVLGSLLAPILEFVIGLFSKAVSYVNAFVQALTGINLVARANAKAINNQAKSTKKLSEAQSSLDEFHTINKDSGSGGSDNKPITVEPVDISKLDVLFEWIDKAKQLLATLFDPIKQAWDNKGKAFIDSLKNAFDGLKNLASAVFSSLFEVWTNGTGQTIVENILQMWTNVFNIIGALGNALANAWNNAGNGTAIIRAIADIFIGIQDIVISISQSLLNWFISDGFQSALNVILGVLADLFGYDQEIIAWVVSMYDTYLAPVVDKILDCISRIIIAIGSVWDFLKPVIDTIISVIMDILEPVIEGLCGIIGGIIDALSGVMDFITGVFTGDWSKAWNGIKLFFSGIIDALKSLFIGLINTIGALFKGAWDLIKSIWGVVSSWFNNAIIKPLSNFFSGMWNGVKNGAKNCWNGIKNIFSSVASFFKNIFTNAWNGVKAVFSTGGRIFSGITDGIVSAFKKVVNTIIAGINKVVAIPFNGINTALKKVRDVSFLNISPFKNLIELIDVPQIPSLATGGVLSEETLVRVAEYSNAKSNPEIVSPKDMMKETFKEAIEETGMNQMSSKKIEVEVTGETRIDGDDIVITYDKAKNNKGYDGGGKNPSFAY